MDSVEPLRIAKSKGGTPSSSPNKMAPSRPLSEIGSTERRRNSPSYNQATRKHMVSHETSPYTENSSPPSFNKPSPRDFWSTRELLSPSRFDNSENTPERSPSPAASPHRRPSVERLQKAGRVKTSNIFALETKDAYDPSSLPIVERPTANRPLSEYLVNNSFARADSMRKENNPFRSPGKSGHRRTESEITLPMLSPTKQAAGVPLPASPEKGSNSPTKSSLSRNSQFGTVFDELDAEDRVPTPRALHRHAKSVTFHEDPPVINEYEHPTPEPSVSVASDREGSWDSEDFEDGDYSFERYSSAEPDRDDSFDADLENADKTPVVLPEYWSRMSPDEARTDLVNGEDDVFDNEEATQRPIFTSRIASDSSESRPLPPIPGFTRQDRRDSDSLSSAAERAASATRNVASPPKRASCSKDDILKMGRDSSKSLQERLGLMGAGEDSDRPQSKSSQETVQEELTITNLDTGERRDFHVEVTEKELPSNEDSLADMSTFVDAPPRISRESILRKVRGSKYDFDDEDDEVDESQFMGDETTGRPTIEELARLNPDQPVPSRENSRETSGDHQAVIVEQQEEVVIKDEPVDEEQIDLNSIPVADERSPSRMDDYDRQNSGLQHGMPRSFSDSIADDDTASRYSSEAPDAESTMLFNTQTTLPTEVSAGDDGKETLDDAMALLSVKDYAEAAEPTEAKQGSAEFMGLPAYLASEDFDFGMKEYITPPGSSASNIQSRQLFDAHAMPNLQPPADPEPPQAPEAPYAEPDVSPPGTPDSVIHKPDEDGVPVSPIDGPSTVEPEHLEPQIELPEVPERKSTIRTSGKLKTRKSNTQADLEAMSEQRRMVSVEMRENPVPAIPQQYQGHGGAEDAERPSSGNSESQVDSLMGEEKVEKTPNRRKSRKSGGRMDLMLDTSTFSIGDTEGLGLDSEFDKVIEAQKVCHGSVFPPPSFALFPSALQPPREAAFNSSSRRPAHMTERTLVTPYSPHTNDSNRAGADRYSWKQKGYLMRQNTKLVVATNRNVSGSSDGTATSNSTAESNETPLSPTTEATPRPTSSGARPKSKGSPRKGSAEQFLKTEPWIGKQRRKSLRNASAAKTAIRSEPAPPLPGHESALGVVDEDFAAGTASLDDDVEDGVERGRLFVKVIGVKDLDLPLPRNDRVNFQLTLDNGLHCVTTTELELGRSAPIGQEFELVVLNDLEFQLTLNTNLPPPPTDPIQLNPPSLTKSPLKSGGALSRFLTSPKKRAEKERQEREAAEAEERRLREEAARKRASRAPTAWDLLHDLVNGADGSFARAYVNLKSHEQHCFGRQMTVDIPCYNEWAAERDNTVINSVRSKRGAQSGPVRRPPYVIGNLELQLLYVPRPRGAADEHMPKSMSSAVREMNRASSVKEITHEGCLSQQGGDCTHWRRRFFRLQNSKLTAYHEHTHQKRAVINLAKASRLVDDKTTLVADIPSSPSKSGKGRRKSGFAEEDEGYAYVEEGFRIRFANGETIDFYADSRALKDEWMVALSQVIGKPDVVAKKDMKWTDLVLARERAQPAPLNGQGVAVKDFSPTKTSQPTFAPAPPPKRELSHRKPVSSATGSGAGSPTKTALPTPTPVAKSAPTSPWKPGHGFRKSMPVNEMVAEDKRPKTPPMNPRRGHRSRDAVKSMIF